MRNDNLPCEPIIAAIETMRASWLQVRLAILFGKKYVAQDGDTIVTIYQWRGVSYLTECKQ